MGENYTQPIVSIIIPVFNQQQYIGRCLRSLLHQTLPHGLYEIIVINDGSTDLTTYALEQFVDAHESPIRVLVNEANLGLPASINRGIRAARGEYIVRVDSDDFVNSNFINFLRVYLETNQHIDAVACDYILLDDEENVLQRNNCDVDPIACGIMFRKSHLLEIGLYDEAFRLHEERELRIRFEKKYKIQRLDIPLYRYRRHVNNITNDKVEMDRYLKNLTLKHGENDNS
ncbi:glycosyltransferase family 2 protein [Polynucleobacter paneuropaeus]|nr:glycosyltransferase family 2 protein [Polynucleobacter paneuropaeus]